MKSYQLAGRRVISLNFQRRAISANVPATEELLCCPCRVILKRVKDTVDSQLRDQQAGFRKNRSCTDSPVSGIPPCISTSLIMRRHLTVWIGRPCGNYYGIMEYQPSLCP